MKKAGIIVKRFLGMALSLAMVVESLPVEALARGNEEYMLPEVGISQEILDADVFYLGTTQAAIPENGSGRYLLKVARGGDALTESTALVKIADMTAKYGEDYVVSVKGSLNRVEDPKDNESLLEMIRGSEVEQSELKDDEEAMAAIEEDEEGLETFNEALGAAADYITDSTGLSDEDQADMSEGNAEDAEPDETVVTGEPVITEEESEDQTETEADVIPSSDSGETVLVGGEDAGTDPVQQARNMFAHVEDGRTQRLTSDQDMAGAYQDLQKVANLMTEIVVGASVELSFKPGEKEKYLEITPKNNSDGDGDRMFYMILGAPTGTTTNSAASTCAFTILDDEESEPAVLSFSEAEYVHKPGTDHVTVTINRSGAIGKVVSARVRTKEGGSALAGRDYSEVDRDLCFPFGIESLTVDIPVRTIYFNDEKDFYLELEPTGGCEVSVSEARVSLQGTFDETTEEEFTDAVGSDNSSEETDILPLGTETEANSLSKIVTLDPISIKDPWKAVAYNGHTGHNGWEDSKKRWRMDWTGSANDSNKRITEVTYKLSSDNNPYWLDGAQVIWGNGGGNCKNGTYDRIEMSGREHSWYTHPGDNVDTDDRFLYNEKSSYWNGNRNAVNMYPGIKDSLDTERVKPNYLNFQKKAGCDDCDWLYVYEIRPILRPFVFQYAVNTTLKFLDENGNYESDDGMSTEGGIVGSDADKKVVLFINDGSGVTVNMNASVNTEKYVRLTGLKISPDGKSWYDFGVRSTDEKSAHFDFNENTLKKIVNKMGEKKFFLSLIKNPFLGANVDYYGTKCQPMYSKLYVRPEFEKIPAHITLRNPYDYPVTMTVDTYPYELQAKETLDLEGFYLGDKLSVNASVSEELSADMDVKGLGYWRKYDGASSWENYTFTEIAGGQPLKFGSPKTSRLNYQYMIIEPRIAEKNNSIQIRVKNEDLGRFDRSQGLFRGTGTSRADDPGYTYFKYADANSTVIDKLYPISVDLTDDDYICRWYDAISLRYYEGNTLYFTASGDPERNVITLQAIEKKYDTRLTGTLRYIKYDLMTRDAGRVSTLPASGTVITAGSAGAVADEKGWFETGEIPYHGPDIDAPHVYLRYLVTVNGIPQVEEIELRMGRNVTDISSALDSGVNPVNSEIFNNIRISAEYKEGHGYNVENGSYLPIVTTEEVTVNVKLKPAQYTFSSQDEYGRVMEEEKLETPQKIQLILYDENGKIRTKYDVAEKPQNADAEGFYTFSSKIYFAQGDGSEGEDSYTDFKAMAGDMLFVRVYTDRSTVNEEEGEAPEYVYSDLFTGYTMVWPTQFRPPVKMGATSPVNIKYKKLPFLDDTGMNLALPFATVSVTRTSRGGWRLSIGASVAQIIDTVKGSHMATYAADTNYGENSEARYWKDIFSIKDPFKTTWSGLKQSYNAAFGSQRKDLAKKIDEGSVGYPTWKFDLVVGAYFDFEFPEVSGGVAAPDYLFVGFGGFMAVTFGFKMTWYWVFPILFIPVYFGIELEGTVTGYLGAEANPSETIAYDDTLNASVNFDDSIDEFSGSVTGAGLMQISIGAGLCGLIGIRGVGNVQTIANYAPSDIVSDFGFYCSLNVGFLVDLFLFSKGYSWKVADWKKGAFEEYSKMNLEPSHELPVSEGDTPEPLGGTFGEGFKLREGSQNDSVWMGDTAGEENVDALGSAFIPNAQKEAVLVDNAYERPDSKLITLNDGTVVLAFVDSDNSKGRYQRTTAKLASYKNGKWSEPVAVAEDGTADFQPSIAEMKDGRIMVAWVSTGADDITDETDLVTYLNSMEIYTAIAEVAENGEITLTEPVKITNDRRIRSTGEEHYYDCKPTVICDMISGDVMVYYIKSGRVDGTEEELANPYTNDSVICYMPYSYEGVDADGEKKQGWLFDHFYEGELGSEAEEQFMIENFGGQRFLDSARIGEGDDTEFYSIPDFTAISYNGLGVYAYSVDPDGSLDTNADREIFLQLYDFETHKTLHVIQLTDDDIADTMPKLFRSKMASSGEGGTVDDATDTKLFWYKNDKEVVYIDVTNLIRYGINEDGTFKDHKDHGSEEASSYADPHYTQMATTDSHAAKEMADFVITEDDKGSIYMIWTESENGAQEICAASLLDSEPGENPDGLSGKNWSPKYQLTSDGHFNDEIAVTLSGEDLMIVHNRFDQALNVDGDGNFKDENDPLTFENMQLVATVLEPCGAVETENLTIMTKGEDDEGGAVKLPAGGDRVDVKVDVVNAGLTVAKGFKTELYSVNKAGEDTLIGTITDSDGLIPGESRQLTFEDHTLPEDVEGLRFKVVTRELKEGEIYYENDHKPEYISEPLEKRGDYSFDEITAFQLADGFHVSGIVTNNGNAAAPKDEFITVRLCGPFNMDMKFEAGERVLAKIPIGGLKPGESRNFGCVQESGDGPESIGASDPSNNPDFVPALGEDVHEFSGDEISTGDMSGYETIAYNEPLKVTAEMLKEYGYVEVSLSVTEDRTFTDESGHRDTVRYVLGDTAITGLKAVLPFELKASPLVLGVDEKKAPSVYDALGNTYDGSALTYMIDDQDIAVLEGGSVLGLNKGYATLTVTHTDTGLTVTAPVIVGGSVNEEDFETMEDISDGLWNAMVDGDEFIYCGVKVTPSVHVYDGTAALAEGKDYRIAYANNVKAYTLKPGDTGFDPSKAPKVILTGKGNYKNREEIFFTIQPVNLYSDPDIYADDMALAYSGKDLTPRVTVEYRGKKLKAGKDFDLQIREKGKASALSTVKNPGEYDMVITGKDNYTGSRIVGLTVYDKSKCKPVSALSVAKIPACAYTGAQITPEVSVKDGKNILTGGSAGQNEYVEYDYFVKYINNINAGTAWAVVTGNPEKGYAGSRRIKFNITGKSIKGAKLTGLNSAGYEYTGSYVNLDGLFGSGKLGVTAKDGTGLVPDNGNNAGEYYGYTVSYKKNLMPGNAEMILTGTGGCTGTAKFKFRIAKGDLNSDRTEVILKDDKVPFAKGGSYADVVVRYNGRKLAEGTDYVVSCENNKKTGDNATVTIKGRGNFTGTFGKPLGFTVVQADLENMTACAGDVVFKNKAGNFKTKLTVTDAGGKKLKAGSDYDKKPVITYAEDGEGHSAGDPVLDGAVVPAGTRLLMTVNAVGNDYKGSISTTYRITQGSISKVKLSGKIADKQYTGEEITLKPEDIPLAVKASETDKNGNEIRNWEIVEGSYKNNVKKGTASVTIRGLGDYGQTKTLKFKITARDLKWAKTGE